MAIINQDLTNVEAKDAFDPMPAGWYPAMIVDSEMRQTKKGDGHYLNLELCVLEGSYKNRRAWDRLNLDNPNATAVEIAQRTLRAITDAIGHAPQVADSVTLHSKPMLMMLGIEQGQNGPSNVVKGYKAMAAATHPAMNAAAPMGSPAPVAPAAAPAAPAKAPWRK